MSAFPAPRAMAYNMSKAAIEHMARTAAIEVAEFKIRINLIQPGWTDTPGELKLVGPGDRDLQAASAQPHPRGRRRPGAVGGVVEVVVEIDREVEAGLEITPAVVVG